MTAMNRFRKLVSALLVAALVWTTAGIPAAWANDELSGQAVEAEPAATGSGGGGDGALAGTEAASETVAGDTYAATAAQEQAPRLVGDLQSALGEPNWSPADAGLLLKDEDGDRVFEAAAALPKGRYEYKIVLGTSWEAPAYPASNAVLELSAERRVTFVYDADTHEVSAVVDSVPEGHLRIHYKRTDGRYEGLGLWLWNDVASPSADWPAGAVPFATDKRDSFGAYMDVQLAAGASKVGFLVVNRTSGEKDGGDKSLQLASPSMNEVWIKQGDDTVYTNPDGEIESELRNAELVADDRLLLGFNTTEGLDEATLLSTIAVKDRNGAAIAVRAADIQEDGLTVALQLSANVDPELAPLAVEYGGRTVSAKAGWRLIDNKFAYGGDDLGATYLGGGVELKLWAPKASAVRVNFYDKDDSSKQVGTADLTLGEYGVWSARVNPEDLAGAGVTDLRGYYYQYEVTNGGVTKKVLDPYAKSMAEFRVNTKGEAGPDGDTVGKAAIVDLSGTDPEGFGYADIEGYNQREDAIVWEAHIRDFTSDPSIEGDLHARWGSYKAFIDKLPYIKSLGVTHIQLLPVMAWYYGDEAAMGERETKYSAKDNEYNWGYDPHSYFSPDGAYSENAKDPELRIKELKQLIDAIHKAGMGVVLDVVYTHMAKVDLLNDIVPDYYAFQNANGDFLGDFGNNLATNRAMAEKLMIDSVEYWFDEYKIDGMRWDMMGDATYPAVQKAYDAAAKLNPNALFIGEGWRTFKGDQSDPSLEGMGADQDWMDKTDNVAVFSDEIRNELKSGYGSEGEPRFITGGARDIRTILNNIKGQPSNTAADDPGDIVPYIEAHDNLTLYDVIAQSIRKDPAIPENDVEIHKRIRLGNLLVLTSQGTAFLHAGQEYGRTKQWLGDGVPEQKYHALADESGRVFGYFVHDSYDSSDAINRFDWTKAADADQYPVNHATSEYTKGLIELRRHTDAFRLGDRDLVNSNVTLIEAPEIGTRDLVIAYKNASMDGTGDYYVFVNADNRSRTLTLPLDLTAGTVVADNDEAGADAVASPSGFELTAQSIAIDPLSAVIIRMDSKAQQVVSIQPDSGDIALETGDNRLITVYAHYDGGSRTKVKSGASFSSSRPSVAAVAADGTVTAIGPGQSVITVQYQGFTAEVRVEVTEPDRPRVLQFNYIRPDADYNGWNIWVWGTGVRDGQIVFDKVENGVAAATIEVADDAVGVGFVLRKGTDWNTAKQDIPYDRMIPLTEGDRYTKVNVRSMVGEIDVFPSLHGPYLEDGHVTFRYRDETLFAQGLMSEIERVQVRIGGRTYDMAYDPAKEWFEYTLRDIAPGSYEYSFLVARDGSLTERPDPANAQDGISTVMYRKPEVKITGSVQPGAVDYNDNAVLRLSASSSEPVSFREGRMDLSELGGPSSAGFNVELMAHTIAVNDSVSAGVKNIPVTLVDQYGNARRHNVKVTVKPRTGAGALDFDWDESRIYFVLTDRFNDGDPSNNDKADKQHLEAYHGGDFKGLIEKLDYLDELGINTLWITPIVDNIDFSVSDSYKHYGYHGYWAKDFTQLDEHLGDLDTFKTLIDQAHDRGIKIMVDVVLNHTGYGLKPGDNTEGVTEEDKARFAGMLRTSGLSADVNPVKGELSGLPDLMTENAEVREKIIAWQTGWLERARTDRGDTIDYFRVDTVKHVDTTTWVAFKNELTAIDPGFKLLGEYFGGTVEADGGMLASGQMDALLDFGFKEQARDFANGSVDAVDAYLQEREAKLSNTATMAQFLSSHDENGFLSHYVNGDKSKLMVAAALQITAKGMPVVYYGEELGRSGRNAGDMGKGEYSENRGDMPWDKLGEERKLHDHYKKLLNIRAEYSKLYAKGVRTKLAGSDELGYLAFNKAYGGENIVTVINTAETPVSVTLSVPFLAGTTAVNEYGGETYTVSAEGTITVQVPGRADGGTAILSGVSVKQDPDGGTGGGRDGGGSSEAGTGQWPGAAVISSEALESGLDGAAEVTLPAETFAALLPIDAAKLLAGQDLQLAMDGVTVRLPYETLADAAALPFDESGPEAFIRFEAMPLTAGELAEAAARGGMEGLTLKPASGAYTFRLTIVQGGQAVAALEQPGRPIVVSIKLDRTVNPDIGGIYEQGEGGYFLYRGGDLQGDTMVAELNRFGTYVALEYDRRFRDVPDSHWAAAAVRSLAAKGVVEGVNGDRFAPDAGVTRAQFAAMLVRALGADTTPQTEGTFADVQTNDWFAPYAEAAYRLGLVKGRDAGTFDPDAAVTREEMAVMLLRAYRLTQEAETAQASATVSAAYADAEAVSGWAAEDLAEATALGLVHGRDGGRFEPEALLSRAESAQAVYNLLTTVRK